MRKKRAKLNPAADLIAFAISRIIAIVVGWFSVAWIIMLMLGTLLGNQGLWTPAYWECFGAVYLMTVITSFVARNWSATLAVEDRKRAEFVEKVEAAKAMARKPVI